MSEHLPSTIYSMRKKRCFTLTGDILIHHRVELLAHDGLSQFLLKMIQRLLPFPRVKMRGSREEELRRFWHGRSEVGRTRTHRGGQSSIETHETWSDEYGLCERGWFERAVERGSRRW